MNIWERLDSLLPKVPEGTEAFKIGDRVKILPRAPPRRFVGMQGEIVEFSKVEFGPHAGFNWYRVRFSEDETVAESWYMDDHLEKVS